MWLARMWEWDNDWNWRSEEEEEVYTRPWMKKILEKKYVLRVYFIEMLGKTNVVCFRDTAGGLTNNK